MKNVKSLFLKGGFICAFMFSALSSSAENYPYRSDVLWVTVPDHADWLYKTGEKAEVEVQFYKYGIPQDGVEVKYELGGDMMPADKTGYTASIFDVLKKLFLLWHRLPIPAFSCWPPFHKKQ